MKKTNLIIMYLAGAILILLNSFALGASYFCLVLDNTVYERAIYNFIDKAIYISVGLFTVSRFSSKTDKLYKKIFVFLVSVVVLYKLFVLITRLYWITSLAINGF